MTANLDLDYSDVLTQAIQWLEKGHLQEAKLLALQLTALSSPPRNEHYRLLGHIAYQEENFSLALKWVEEGLKISQDSFSAFYELKGMALQKLNLYEEARLSFKESLLSNPFRNHAERYYFLYSLKKETPEISQEALQVCNSILSKINNQNHSELWSRIQTNKAIALTYLDDYEAALTCFLAALKADSSKPSAFFNVGYAHFHLKNYLECIDYIKEGFNLDPYDLVAFERLSLSYLNMQKIDDAYQTIHKALKIDPNNISLKITLAQIKKELHLNEEAKQILTELISSGNTSPLVYAQLADLYKKEGCLDKALEILNEGSCLFPTSIEIDSAKGILLRLLGDFDLYEFYTRKALVNSPRCHELLFNLSLIELRKGHFKTGWELYTQRLHTNERKLISSHMKLCKKPLWKGESLKGKSILVHYEQGAGDFLQFCRYLPWLRTHTEQVYLSTPENLGDLVEYNHDLLKLTPPPSNFMEEISYQVPIAQLPLIHQTDFDNMVNNIPYLKANPRKKEPFKNLFSTTKIKVGIFWQGSPDHKEDRYRSNRLTDWLPLIERFKDQVQFYSLQKGFGEEQLNEIDNDGSLIPLGPYFHNYGDTAAAIDMLDLMISVDSSVVHLCGALGKPVWILLPLAPDWRWLVDREDSPWYPTARLFRTQKHETWNDIFYRVKQELITFIKNH